jgi:hypothetical protein
MHQLWTIHKFGRVARFKGGPRFARNVSIHLKYNRLSEYGHVFESPILPLVRKQTGFKDEITFAMPGGLDVRANRYSL